MSWAIMFKAEMNWVNVILVVKLVAFLNISIIFNLGRVTSKLRQKAMKVLMFMELTLLKMRSKVGQRPLAYVDLQ